VDSPYMNHFAAKTSTDDDLAYVQAGMGTALETMLVFNLLRTHSYLGPCVDAGCGAGT